MIYITIAPLRLHGKYFVARKGSGKNHYIVAECPSEGAAHAITDALNAARASIPNPQLDVVRAAA